uniref:Ig-like domain-containing protein n=1 Tax=Periophthalmus magnuspinnatus TaxID=409849 RepID=A0A3B4A2N9_9GOBI
RHSHSVDSVWCFAAVIGPSLPVMALLGEDVILPCRCDPARDLGSMTVEWSRTDVKPAPSDPLKRSKFVHMYRNRKDDMDMKIEEYINRTQLFPEQFGAGNASLRIRSVRLSDNATYKCFVPNLSYDTSTLRRGSTRDMEKTEERISTFQRYMLTVFLFVKLIRLKMERQTEVISVSELVFFLNLVPE